jgi:carbonic anhydrase
MPRSSQLTILAAACAIAAAGPSPAATWQMVNSNASVQTEVDLASANRKDGTVTGWVQHTYSKKTTTQSGAYFVYRTMKEQVRLNCTQQTASVLTRAYFDDDGAEIASIKGNGEARNVVPDSPEHRVLTRLCNPTTEAKAPRLKETVRESLREAGATPVAATDPRYMDGPVNQPKPGIVRAKADAHDAHDAPAAAPSIVKPIEKIDPKAVEKADPKAAEKAPEKGSPAAAGKIEKPAAAAHGAAPAAAAAKGHGAPAAHAPAKGPVREVSNPFESREATVARVLKSRAGAPVPPEGGRKLAKNSHVNAANAAAASVGHDHEAHWDYEGENAPYRWGDMKSDFATCKSGTRQSPIDIRNPVVSETEPIRFFYEDVPLKVSNNGHTIQVEVAPGSFIMYGGTRYELLQFHFHSPSEERVNGRAFDMVAHLVHKSAQGRLAVVAVLLSAGAEQAVLQKVWAAMPGTRDRTRERLDVTINAAKLLPADQAFYSYMGSLTTPPCTEGVQWLVMKTPMEISREQIGHFTALYPMNARPLQALNDRLIKIGK